MAIPSAGVLDGQDSLTEVVATACQVLADTGLSTGILGHVSVRVPGNRALVRCRGPRERGLAFTTADDIKAVPIDPDAGSDLDGWAAPNELPIHTAILRARPDATAVVHAHPPAVVTASLARVELAPIFGAYDITAARLAAAGIPTWPRAVLVNTGELGDDLARCLGDRAACVLYGHGLVSVGGGTAEHAIAEAVTIAVSVEILARTTLAVLATGARPAPIEAADLRQLPDLGGGFTVDTMWRHLVARAASARR